MDKWWHAKILIVRDNGFTLVALNKRFYLINGTVVNVQSKEIKLGIQCQEVFL
jgi:hypothetical protein